MDDKEFQYIFGDYIDFLDKSEKKKVISKEEKMLYFNNAKLCLR